MFHALMLLGQIIHAPDIADAALLLVQKHVRCKCRIHQKFLGRIGNSHGQSRLNCQRQECGINKTSLRHGEGNVGQTADRGKTVLFAIADGLQRFQCSFRIGTYRCHQTVHHDIFFAHSQRKCPVINLVNNLFLLFYILGQSRIRQRKQDKHSTVFGYNGK